MRTRRGERDRVVDLLESDAFDSADALADAVLRSAVDVVSERGMYVVGAVGAPMGWGPFWTELEAQKAWNRIGASFPGRHGFALRVFPWREDPARDRLPACVCGHHEQQHVRGRSGSVRDCGVRGCGCENYSK